MTKTLLKSIIKHNNRINNKKIKKIKLALDKNQNKLTGTSLEKNTGPVSNASG